MADPWVLVQTTAAVVTALAASGAFVFVRRGIKTLREHDRVLFGEESVQGWDGIVPTVQRNRAAIEALKEDAPNHSTGSD